MGPGSTGQRSRYIAHGCILVGSQSTHSPFTSNRWLRATKRQEQQSVGPQGPILFATLASPLLFWPSCPLPECRFVGRNLRKARRPRPRPLSFSSSLSLQSVREPRQRSFTDIERSYWPNEVPSFICPRWKALAVQFRGATLAISIAFGQGPRNQRCAFVHYPIGNYEFRVVTVRLLRKVCWHCWQGREK